MATIELNYNNIRQNAINLKEQAQDIIAVVKNNAYNLDLRECVKLYSEVGINYFATTKEEECKVIRETLGENANIFLLNPTYDFALAREYNIEINIASLEYLKENLENVRDLTLQLEFAGSMRRAGARNLEEVLEIIDFCKENSLKLKGFWSHFSFADEFDGFYEKEKELDNAKREKIKSIKEFVFKYRPEYLVYLVENKKWENARNIGYWRTEGDKIKIEYFVCSQQGTYFREQGEIKGDTIVFYQNFYHPFYKEVRERYYVLSDMSFE